MIIKKIFSLIFILLIIAGIILGIKVCIRENNVNIKRSEILKDAFADISDVELEINKLYTYGKGINLSGVAENINKDNFENVKLVVRDGNDYDKSYNLDYELDKENKKLYFSTNNNMNTGIVIDELQDGEYFLFIRIKTNNSINPKYYSIKKSSDFFDGEIDYYTVTDENGNRKAEFNFDKYNVNNKELSFLSLSVKTAELPEDIYDIVIDAGHGGNDPGEMKDGVSESKLMLEYAELLEDKLVEAGYKVLLTRNSDNTGTYTTTNMYDDGGRIIVANESKAKLMISLHVNSDQAHTLRGVEVYSPPKSNLDFATKLAKNIQTDSLLEYSNNKSFKKAEGVYVRNFTDALIKVYEDKAKNGGYEPYDLTTDTAFLYTIREVGGIATNAYVDGRNKVYGDNEYYKSCQGIECYQLELGYVANDFGILQNDKETIVEIIADTIIDEY